MKRILAFVTFFGLVHFSSASPHITIGDLKLVRAYAPAESESQLREYLPEGENLERWNRLASVRVFAKEKNPQKYLERVADMVRKSSPAARAEFFRNEQKKETVLDFITFAPPGAPEHFAEWNMMRAKYVKGTGLVVYQYALRLYVIDDDSISVLTSERRKMMAPFVEASFEEKEEPNQ
ncbi:MAG: hypothetical protein KBC32_11375 [Candidatus Didemnitutus sp.]|nr:hypothetical protein [Candidatus Didemnitutus sp.]